MPANDEVLTVGIELDIRKALQQVKKFQRAMTDAMDDVTKSVKDMADANAKMAKDSAKDVKKQTKQFDDLEDAVGDAMKAGGKKAGGKKGLFHVDQKALSKEAGKGLTTAAEGFKGMLSKDLKGIIQNSAKALRGTLGAAVKGVAVGGLKVGGKLQGAGEGLSARGRARPGALGTGMRAAGASLKLGGKVAGGMGKAVGAIAKIGPLLTMAATAIVKIVELFIDAEAQTKQFQKDILQTASTIEFMGANSWDTKKAFTELEHVVEGMRDAAFDFPKNWAMGIGSAEFKAVYNTLQGAGVSIKRIGEEAANQGVPVKEFASELVHVSVAYSRAFGQPLSEINQLQAEMMTDLGMSAEGVKMSFAKLGRQADDSGIAANKFFAIIRGASQDMSLYNMRMSDAAKTLKMLSKVMNPRNAAKFFGEAMQGLKNMGREEKLRLTMLAGTKNVSKAVSADIESKTRSMSKQLQEATKGAYNAKEIQEKFKKGGIGALEPILKSIPKEMQGSLREGFLEVGMQGEMAKKGTFGTAMAAGQMGMPGAISVMTKALGKFGGGKKLMDIVGTIGGEMMAQNLGISEEQLHSYAKMEYAIDAQRKGIADELIALQNKSDLTTEESERLKQLNDAGFKSSEDVMKGELQNVYDVMDDGAKEAAQDAAKIRNFAEEQTTLQTSLVDRLDQIIEFLVNQLYNVLMDLWKMFAGSTMFGTDESRRKLATAEAAKNVKGSAKGELAKVAGAENIKAAMAASQPVKAMNKALDDLAKLEKEKDSRKIQIETLTKAVKDPEILKADPGAKGRLDALKAEEAKYKKLDTLRAEQFKELPKEAVAQMGRMAPGMQEEVTGTGGKRMTRGEHLEQLILTPGMTTDNAMAQAGVTGDMMSDMMRKMPWLDPNRKGGGADMITRMGGISQDLEAMGYPVEATEKTQENTAKAADSSAQLLHEGTSGSTLYFKFPNGFLNGAYADTIEDATLYAFRRALFEYYLYSGMDRSTLVKQMKEKGSSPVAMAKEAYNLAKRGEYIGNTWAAKREGGGILGRLKAKVKSAKEAGVAAAGGGGGGACNVKVEIALREDAAKIFKATVIDTVYEAKRKEKRI